MFTKFTNLNLFLQSLQIQLCLTILLPFMKLFTISLLLKTSIFIIDYFLI